MKKESNVRNTQNYEKELTGLCSLYLEYCYYEKQLSENSIRSYKYDLIGLVRYAKSYVMYGKNAFNKNEKPGCEIKITENEKFAVPNRQNTKNLQYVSIQKLDKEFWYKYMTELSAVKKVRTVKRKLACFTGFFYFLENKGIIQENPLCKFKLKLKAAGSVPETLSLKEIKRIFDIAYRLSADDVTGLTMETAEVLRCRDIAVLELLFSTGLRVSELCAISFAAYDSGDQSLRVLGKGGKERTLYLGNSGVIDALEKYIELRLRIGPADSASDAIFLNRWGKPLSCQAVRDLVKKYCKAAGISRNITPHAFRHTFASLLLEEGVELRYIQEFLGHSSITTTQIYLHTSEKRKREILTKMHPRKKLGNIIK